jgi:hypothetical protein
LKAVVASPVTTRAADGSHTARLNIKLAKLAGSLQPLGDSVRHMRRPRKTSMIPKAIDPPILNQLAGSTRSAPVRRPIRPPQTMSVHPPASQKMLRVCW